jgi:YhcN/YlaJ family sporulation lipoprotein
MKKRHYLISVLALILIVMFVVSCAPARRPGDNVPRVSPGTRQTRFVPRNAPNRAPMPTTDPGPLTQNRRYNPYRTGNQMRDIDNDRDNDMQDRAERIADAAARQKEVESASCVITGNTALVGLQFDKQYKGKLTDAIKRKVEERVKDTDARINNVVVTADPDMVTRIETMFRDIGRGKPISGFAEEINEMINRIKPTTK